MNLSEIPLIEQHAHNILKSEVAANYPFAAAFTEGYDPEIVNYHAKHTLFYRRSLREIATLLNCEPEETAILAHRQNLGLENLTRIYFEAANLEAIYLDDGLTPENILPISWHQQFTTVKRILRLELLAEKLLSQIDEFHTFVNAFIKEIDPPSPDIVAFKSIACYRSGLDIRPVAPAVAAVHFYDFKKLQKKNDLPLRLNDKQLIDFILQQSLIVAAKYKIPVQLHTGLGDPDLDLRLANPLNLRYLIECPQYKNAPLVLLHASYPYMREAGYLASMYPQVYLDFGLAVPFLSVAGMRNTIRQLLELIPTTKLMYSSDAHSIPELYYLGAKWGRQLLGEVLDQAIKDTDITVKEAEEIGLGILRENALSLYGQRLKEG
ncbi:MULTISPECIES: amidohydrolase family protein [Sphaerospermopsis]|uniref:Amidohydrolase 2 n=2 Tax=Sphaerospermopsis TaxID=752201 RepID=A0A480A3B4_9CYAN|nr:MULTISPECIES: amidohydrolase family protein [Sphaerospermopsis]MBD2147769.1 amidohydrolase family protein [Sphaerospermopsis sp. FACHB-1194]MBE9238953.1 amidohydrolase family protein [Sphaerospermopsis aphanizomenoides LEGE 00250]GCL39520.1 amidohydrolase 2 [Sphaerospermopsis reniformis]